MCIKGNHSLCLAASLWVLCLPVLAPGQPCATGDLIVVDDFESYNEEAGKGTRVCEIWIPYPYPYGYEVWPCYTWLEYENVHSGRQAMGVGYDYGGPDEWYQGVEWWFGHPADWTVDGVDTFVVHVRGLATNTPVPLCLRLKDTAAKACTVTHPNPRVLLTTQWIEWRIPLSSFTGVNLTKIERIYIGAGEPGDRPPVDASGGIYIDDIWLAKASSLPSIWAASCVYPADGDVNVPQAPLLKWSPGFPADGYGIYFGTDANAVAAATPATGDIYRGRQIRDLTSFAPGTLEWGKKHSISSWSMTLNDTRTTKTPTRRSGKPGMMSGWMGP
jgi:hypothetical protein